MTDRTNNQFPAVSKGRIGEEVVQTVNARDLYAFLGANKDFSNWIKYQIGIFGFEEGRDYAVVAENGEQCFQGVTQKKDYFLTLDMAKELAMLSRCEKGKQARQYFIECERVAKGAPAGIEAVLESPAAMRGLLLTYTERVIALEAENKEMAADVAALDRIAKADGSLCMTDAAKALQQRPKDLMSFLSSHGWIYRRAGSDHWVGYQTRVQAGDLEHKVTTVLRSDGTEKITEQVRVTSQGLAKLGKLFPPPLASVA